MKNPPDASLFFFIFITIVCFIAGMAVLNAKGNKPTLEDRLTALENRVDAYHRTTYTSSQLDGASSDQEFMVRLRRKLEELEQRVRRLEDKELK